jgi:hypothetical protein
MNANRQHSTAIRDSWDIWDERLFYQARYVVVMKHRKTLARRRKVLSFCGYGAYRSNI